ncbi:MAG: hypothetical protein Q4P06_04360 [Actinomycetaceae bacterium]|nr:hypothetical protein [Actinomycetaceae bacterium]
MSWWKRNGIWLLLLPVAVAAAGFAASHRFLEIYWPSQPTSPVEVTASRSPGSTDGKKQVAHYVSAFTNSGKEYERDITVSFVGARPLTEWNGMVAAEGTQLWGFDFAFEADPQVIASGCNLFVFDAEGTKYFQHAAQVVSENAGAFTVADCVPPGAEGPMLDFFTGDVQDSLQPRPRTWESTLAVALPRGVEPASVQLFWDLPAYAEFSLP